MTERPAWLVEYWTKIGGMTSVDALRAQRAKLAKIRHDALVAGDLGWLENGIPTIKRIDRRLDELGAEREDPAGRTFGDDDNRTRRKTTQKRPRGYIAQYGPQRKIVDLLDDVRTVLEEYRDHWPLTVRQLFYRLVGAHGYEKSEAFYKRLCHHLANARRGRVIPFEAIRDDGVATVDMLRFDDEEGFRAHVRNLGKNYKRNLLATQPRHLEVWCEAAGMIFQLADVAHPYSVQVYSSSGFDSLTAKKHLADRICEIGKPAIVLHLGDHDPSGESIFDSAAEDVAAFVEADAPWGGVSVRFRRIALTAAQVAEHGLPTAPAKASDPRSRSWSGETCQLEALAPDVIAEILRREIRRVLDDDQLETDLAIEALERRRVALALPKPGDNTDR